MVTDMSDATVVYVYLVPEGLRKILPKLVEARERGARIISNIFSVPGWEPTDVFTYKGLKLYTYH